MLFTEHRSEDATVDDDVRALENVAHVLEQAAPVDTPRIRDLLGDEAFPMLGWTA